MTGKCKIFILSAASPYSLDRTEDGKGLKFFVRKDMPFKLSRDVNPSGNKENIFVEINKRSKSWLISGSYSPNVLFKITQSF